MERHESRSGDEVRSLVQRLLGLATEEIDAPYRLGTCEALESPEVDWLWPGYILRSKPTLLEANGGSGKTRFALQVLAMVTSGVFPMPNAFEPSRVDPARVLVVSDEDEPSEIAQTFRELGGDPALLSVESPQRYMPLEGENVTKLQQEIITSNISAVLLDPALALMPSYCRTQFDNVGITRWMAVLREIARSCRIGLLVVRHWAKGGAGREAHEAGAGGESWRNGSRGQLVLYKHPESRSGWTQVLVVPARDTLRVQYAPAFAFEIDRGEQFLRWQGMFDLQPYLNAYPSLKTRFPEVAAAMDLPRGSRGPAKSAQEGAAEDILRYLRFHGFRARGVDVVKALEARGAARRTVYRASESLEASGVLTMIEGWWEIAYDPQYDLDGEDKPTQWWA